MADSGITVTGDVPVRPSTCRPNRSKAACSRRRATSTRSGSSIYEMVTGQRPFAADTPIASALQRVVGPTPKSPRELKPELPAEWDHAIMRCLARYPDGRFRDASDVAHALDGTLPPRPPQSRLVIAAAVALLVVAGSRRTALARTKHVAGDRAIRSGGQRLRYRPRRSDRQLPCSGSAISPAATDAQWLSMALSEMLTTELAAGERLRTIPGENVTRMKTELALADADTYASETLTRIRQNLGADLVVTGSYVTVGAGDASTLRVDIRLQDSREGETLSLVSEMGAISELLDLVARAGMRLRDKLGVQVAEAVCSRVAAGLTRRRPPLCRRVDPPAPVRCAWCAVDLRAGDQGRPSLPSRTFGAGEHLVGTRIRQPRQRRRGARIRALCQSPPRGSPARRGYVSRDVERVEGSHRDLANVVDVLPRRCGARAAAGQRADLVGRCQRWTGDDRRLQEALSIDDGSAARPRRGASG